MQRKANIYDVARFSEVSHQTVSRVLNNHPSVKPATREIEVCPTITKNKPKIEHVIINEETKIRDFRHELQWNAAYHRFAERV